MNKSRTFGLILIMSLVSGNSYAAKAKTHPSASPSPVPSATPSSKIQAKSTTPSDGEIDFAELFRPFIKTIEKPIYIFHYVRHDRVGQDPEKELDRQDPKIADHLESWSNYFHDTSRSTGQNGGVYAANNPFVSRSYGNILYRIELPAGTRYLDFSEENNKAIPTELRARLYEKYKCSVSSYKFFVWGSPGNGTCLAKVSEALKRLNIGLTAYPWDSGLVDGCERAFNTTFIITDAGIFPKSNVTIHAVKDEPQTDEQKREQAYLTRLFLDESQKAIFPDRTEEARNLSEQEVKDWKGSHLLGCENLRPSPKPELNGGTCSASAASDPLANVKSCLDAANAAAQQVQ